MARQPGCDVFVDGQLIGEPHFLERARDPAACAPVRRQPLDVTVLKADDAAVDALNAARTCLTSSHHIFARTSSQ